VRVTKFVRPHDPNWRRCFEHEAALLRAALGDCLVAMHHIGSTAVPGILAKPTIDILVETTGLSAIDDRSSAMETLGYDVRGAYGIEGRRYFSKKTAPVGFHVHVFERGSPHLTRHLAFRDYLIAKPELARAYSDLKRSLSDEEGRLVPDYVARKHAFVVEVEAAAIAWTGGTQATYPSEDNSLSMRT
jgi:GrpB-like predicted nucleotidyltransferase (UPF0157 family)